MTTEMDPEAANKAAGDEIRAAHEADVAERKALAQ